MSTTALSQLFADVTPIHAIVIQRSFRLDSTCAAFLVQETDEGRRKFPFVTEPRIICWETGTVTTELVNWRRYLRDNDWLLIGVGGSPLDEHPSKEFGDRKASGYSATRLVAEVLGIENSPLYRRLVKEITNADLNTSSDILKMDSLIKGMHRLGMESQAILDWAFIGIRTIIGNQQLFLDADAFCKDNLVVGDIAGTRYRLAWIETPDFNPHLASAAMRTHKGLAAVIVRNTSTGNVQIIGNQRYGVKMERLAVAIRFNELVARGKRQVAEDNESLLRSPGQLECLPCWCYQMPGQNLLNGSETASGLDGTKLPLTEIIRLVREYIQFGK